MKYSRTILALGILLLASCTSDKTADGVIAIEPSQAIEEESMVHSIQLPMHGKDWHTWQCSDGEQFQARVNDKTSIAIQYAGHTYQLKKEKTSAPLIYQNAQIAFFSDGETASLGKAFSGIVLVQGCRIQS